MGYSSAENTWEPEQHLTCPKLIEDFKIARIEEQAKRETERRRQSGNIVNNDAINGFDKQYKVDSILGVSKSSGELRFLIKWKGVVEPEIIPARIANVKCPAEVIKFYEQRVNWEKPPNDNNPAISCNTSENHTI